MNGRERELYVQTGKASDLTKYSKKKVLKFEIESAVNLAHQQLCWMQDAPNSSSGSDCLNTPVAEECDGNSTPRDNSSDSEEDDDNHSSPEDGSNTNESSDEEMNNERVNCNRKPKNLDEMMNQKSFFETIKYDVVLSAGALFMIILKFCLFNSLSQTAMAKPTGVECIVKGVVRKLSMFALLCTVDSVARAAVSGIKQYNGYYGCNWCLHPGKQDGTMRYPIRDVPARTKEATEDIMNQVHELRKTVTGRKRCKGVKSRCPLIDLFRFNIIKGMVPDYMHCILAGVTKQITELLIDTREKKRLVNAYLGLIKAPNQIGRLTRVMTEQWKMREWENWLLYYSLPILSVVLEKDLVNYWLVEKKVLEVESSRVEGFYSGLHGNLVEKFVRGQNSIYFGMNRSLDASTRALFQFPATTRTFPRMARHGSLFATKLKQNKRSDNTVAQLEDGRYIQIKEFVYDRDHGIEQTICSLIQTKNWEFATNIKEVECYGPEILIETHLIWKPCVVMRLGFGDFLCPVPNLHRY
ncbi:hypothetical protein QAD02_005352 [Eretmocerus hayati]|uniref:Uncharacterized protein n=1 Tax=Eretmocerus hayati TaxID=131215 RepID=A0ACC2NSA7_9HYME|nr:hypothetical protein QAD02_005352 [Eretmocerus hayati]